MDESEETVMMPVWHQVLLRIADALWSCLVVFPLCVIYWSSTWKLMDAYLIPDINWASGAASLAIGVVFGIAGYIVLPLLKRCVSPGFAARHIIISRIYLYVHCFVALSFWRGIWTLMDEFATKHWKPSLICACVATVIVLCCRSICQGFTTPYEVTLDNRSNFYSPSPRFRTSWETHRPAAYLLDGVFSHLVIVHLCIQIWRGLWNFFDAFLLPGPDQLLMSYFVSLGLGYGMFVVLCSMQYLFYYIAKRLHRKHPMLELVFQDVVALYIVLGTVMCWRGGWGLFKDYVLVEEWHFVVCHVVGFFALASLHIASTIDIVGVSVDAETGQGAEMILKLDYFLHLYTWWQNRNTNQMLISEEQESDDPYFIDPYDDESWSSSRPSNYNSGVINS